MTLGTSLICTHQKSSFCQKKAIEEYKFSSNRLSHQDKMVDSYITELLKNPELNIPEIPDAIERHLYKFTIKLTLNAIFSSVCQLDGIEILGHHLSLDFLPIDIMALPRPSKPLDRRPLQIFVSKLLKEKLVNIGWLSDSIERQLYFNCLVLIFTVLQSFMGTTKIDLLGHSITIDMSPYDFDYDALLAKTISRRNSVSESIIDILVQDLLASEMNNVYIPDIFEKGMYKTLYALILSLLDELFAHMKVNIIGDQILFQLKPGSLDPNSRFFLGSNTALNNSQPNSPTSHQLTDQYHQLILEEQRCQNILQNIQQKKDSLRNQLSDEDLLSSSELSQASLLGCTLFFVTIGCVNLILK